MSGRLGRGEVEAVEEREVVEDIGEVVMASFGTASLRSSRASRPFETAETEKFSFLIKRIAICWFISSFWKYRR